MPRTLTIVSAGEALLDESGPQAMPSGLALSAAMHAVRLGHIGVAVSRVGQDDAARALLEAARQARIDVEHIQSDPDLPTGRRWLGMLAGRRRMQIDARAAFDNLQWDHDLVDLAMRAHVIVTGAFARRSGQTRAEIDRFVSEARTALKVFDLVNRDEVRFDRREQLAMLELADGVVIDAHAAAALAPSRRGTSLPDAARDVLREFRLQFVIALSDGAAAVHIVTSSELAQTELPAGCGDQHELVVIALLHFLAHGCEIGVCADRAARVVEQVLAKPNDAPPKSLLDVH